MHSLTRPGYCNLTQNQRLQQAMASLQKQTPQPSDPAPISVEEKKQEEEIEALRRERAQLQAQQGQLFAELESQQRRISELVANQERSGASAMPARLQQVATTCAALAQDFGSVRQTIRQELEAGMGEVRRAQAGLLEYTQAQEGETGQLRRLYRAEQAERRRLFNLLQELRGNIRVLVRPRPLLAAVDGGEGTGESLCMRLALEAGEVCLAYGRKSKQFEFDHVFGLQATQAEVYEQVAPVVGSVLDGFNVSLVSAPHPPTPSQRAPPISWGHCTFEPNNKTLPSSSLPLPGYTHAQACIFAYGQTGCVHYVLKLTGTYTKTHHSI
jgi:predicted transcriptional regulator